MLSVWFLSVEIYADVENSEDIQTPMPKQLGVKQLSPECWDTIWNWVEKNP